MWQTVPERGGESVMRGLKHPHCVLYGSVRAVFFVVTVAWLKNTAARDHRLRAEIYDRADTSRLFRAPAPGGEL